jgi:hypothetical protein
MWPYGVNARWAYLAPNTDEDDPLGGLTIPPDEWPDDNTGTA